mgnify:CR=1 FL=1
MENIEKIANVIDNRGNTKMTKDSLISNCYNNIDNFIEKGHHFLMKCHKKSFGTSVEISENEIETYTTWNGHYQVKTYGIDDLERLNAIIEMIQIDKH